MIETEQRAAALTSITITQFALAFMLSGVAVAVPALGREFGASAAQLGLVESGYIAAATALLFPVTRLAEKIGRTTTFALGIVLFTAISLILPQSGSMEQFIVLRVFQGAGGAMMVTTGLAIIADIYPGEGRAWAMGVASAGIFLGISAGPWAGGVITSHLGWRWVFYGGAIPCIFGIFLTLKLLPVRPVITRGIRFDTPGALLGGVGMILLALGGSHLNDPSGMVMMGGSILALAGFVFWEKRAKNPLLDMSLFRGRIFSYGSAVQFISYAATFGVTFLVSLLLQVVMGMTPGQAGTVLLAQPVMMVIFSVVSGKWCERWRPQTVSTAGMAIATVGIAGAMFFGSGSPVWYVIVVLALCGMGNAIFATANMAVIMGAVSQEHYGVASAVVAGMRTTGMTVSLVLISGVLAMVVGPQELDASITPALVDAMQLSFVLLTALCVAGTAMSARAMAIRETGPEHQAVIPKAGKVILQPAAPRTDDKGRQE